MVIHSIILGAVQGITEFLPISSSAHLTLLPYLFNWPWQGLVFDVALHFGTFLAIMVFFWKDIVNIFRSAFSSKSDGDNYPKNMLWIIILATIPGAIAGALLEKQAETIFRDPWLIALSLAIFGGIIWAIDKYSLNRIKVREMNFKTALLVGLAQCLAIVPGVSRSGSTMAAGRALGLKRPDAAKFSFLLAAPIMLGSAIFEARHFTNSMLTTGFILAFIAALVFGLLAIKYLLKYLERGSFAIFAWYRLVLALVVIVVFLLR